MTFLIDGNNVLHCPMPPMLAGLDERGLCIAISRTHWCSTGVTIVFDGRPGVHRPVESPEPLIELVYSGPTRTADDLIMERINADSSPRRMTVVSTDRQIRKAARRRRAASWTSERFIQDLACLIRLGRQGVDQDRKPRFEDLEPEEVQRWLDQFGLD